MKLEARTVPAHWVPEAVVKQLQLKACGPGVGCGVGTGTGVASGVGCVNGTLVSIRGAPGNIGTDGCVRDGGAGGAGATCARKTAAEPTQKSPAIASVAIRRIVLPASARTLFFLYNAEFLITGSGVSLQRRLPVAARRAAMIRYGATRCKHAAFRPKCPLRLCACVDVPTTT